MSAWDIIFLVTNSCLKVALLHNTAFVVFFYTCLINLASSLKKINKV